MENDGIFERWSTYIIIILSFSSLLTSVNLLNHDAIPYQGKKKIFKLHVAQNGDNTCFRMVQNTDAGANFNVTVSGAFPSFIDVKLDKIGKVTYNHNPKLLLWILIFSIAVSSSFGIFLPVLYHISELIKKFRPSWFVVPLLFIVIMIITPTIIITINDQREQNYFSAFDIISHFKVLFTNIKTINAFIVFMTLVGLLAIFGMMLVNYCTSTIKLPKESVGSGNLHPNLVKEISNHFSFLNRKLKFFLTVVSVLILFSVMTTTLIQQALKQVVELEDFDLFPSEFIYSYGLTFSLLLSVIYIPVYYNLKIKGESLIKSLDIHEDDKEKYEPLKLNESLKDNLRIVIVLISPFLGSIATELLKNLSL